MSELLPCPFCGEKRIYLNEPDDPRRRGGSINCPACLVVMPGEVSRNEMIACWNERAIGWEPIDTAPKDGTNFIAVYGDDFDGTFWILFWNDTCFECVSGGHQVDHATHWMPLPTPPEVTP